MKNILLHAFLADFDFVTHHCLTIEVQVKTMQWCTWGSCALQDFYKSSHSAPHAAALHLHASPTQTRSSIIDTYLTAVG